MASNRTSTVYSWLAATARSSNESITNAVLCRSACERLGVDGASVTLMDHPAGEGDGPAARVRQEPVAAADSASSRLEELHLTVGEGPSTAAFLDAVPILVPDLQAVTTRWPGFVSAALADNVAAIFAFPLHIRAWTPGVLTLHRTSPGAMAEQALADGSLFAELAAYLLHTDPAQPLTADTRPDSGPAAARDEVHQAVGMLAVQLGTSMQGAFARLRAYAFTHSTTLTEVAREVLAGRVHLPSDSDLDA